MKQHPKFQILVVLSAILLLVLFSGCNMPSKVIPTEEPSGMIHTVAAQTVAAQMTNAALGVQDPAGDQQPP
ncbi:MAG: hypothetical protein H8D34_25525, partial [Chloroflexi bacterium]|nr:hypothetical protein [Chloroflexota bacterium]